MVDNNNSPSPAKSFQYIKTTMSTNKKQSPSVNRFYENIPGLTVI